jgi:hypothetical protein
VASFRQRQAGPKREGWFGVRVKLVAFLVCASLAGFGAAATPAVADTSPGVHVVCTNTQTGQTILDVTLPTTKIAPGTYTLGVVTCVVTPATFEPAAAANIHVVCVNTVTGQTIVDRLLPSRGIAPGAYKLGVVLCTVTPVP